MATVKIDEVIEKTPAMTFRFSNLTSETKVNENINMVGVNVEGCILELPKASCNKSHQVMITVMVDKPKVSKTKKTVIEAVGKVLEVNQTGERTCEVKIQFTQFVKDEWLYILDLFEKRQNLVTEIVEAMKTPKDE